MNESVEERKIEEPGDLHTAPDWAEQLTAYVDGELETAESSRIQSHVASCARCEAQVKANIQLTASLARLPQLSVPRSFALTPERARRLNPRPLYTAARVALAMAAALLIFVFALDFLGLTNQTTIVAVDIAFATPTPVISLPPIGTRPACSPDNQDQGDVICSNSSSGSIPYTPVIKPTPVPTTISVVSPAPSVRIAEIGLILLVLALAAFAMSVRPRAPTKIRF